MQRVATTALTLQPTWAPQWRSLLPWPASQIAISRIASMKLNVAAIAQKAYCTCMPALTERLAPSILLFCILLLCLTTQALRRSRQRTCDETRSLCCVVVSVNVVTSSRALPSVRSVRHQEVTITTAYDLSTPWQHNQIHSQTQGDKCVCQAVAPSLKHAHSLFLHRYNQLQSTGIQKEPPN